MTAFIPSPSTNALHIGPLSLHLYGLMLAIGVLLAYRIAEWRYKRMGRDPNDIAGIAVVVVICGVIGARVYHLFTGYNWDQGGIAGAFQIWKGGLSIWGAVGGGAIGVIIMCRIRHIDVMPVGDALAPGIVIAQAIGRWGNWFNQELFGRPSTVPWALKIDVAHRPARYLDRATFQPTFLYESLWCLLVFGVVLWAQNHRPLRKGQSFALYAAMYTFGRVYFESLRSDPASKIFGIRFNLLLSAVLCVIFTIWYLVLGRRPESEIAFPYMRADGDEKAVTTATSGNGDESSSEPSSPAEIAESNATDDSAAAAASESSVEPAPDAS
jgi:prolipoprotein diacylglyceryl transferase